jgi:hypothetical protein
MVVTMKKDPTKSKQNFWAAFLSRAVLAVLIAFIISIPLELLIFQENIDLHMDKYKLDQEYIIGEIARRNGSISEKQDDLNKANDDKIAVDNILALGEPQGDPEYSKLRNNCETRRQQNKELYNIYIIASKAAAQAYNVVPTYIDSSGSEEKNRSSKEWGIYVSKRYIKDKTNKDFENDKKELNILEKELNDYLNKWIAEHKDKQRRLNDEIETKKSGIEEGKKEADSIQSGYQTKMKDKKGFVLKFMVLENLATFKNPEENPEGKTIFLLLCLIRILFFTIEILPTIAKIATPIGAYDRAIFQKEKDFELDLNDRTNDYLAQQQTLRTLEYEVEQQQIKDRNKIENE